MIPAKMNTFLSLTLSLFLVGTTALSVLVVLNDLMNNKSDIYINRDLMIPLSLIRWMRAILNPIRLPRIT